MNDLIYGYIFNFPNDTCAINNEYTWKGEIKWPFTGYTFCLIPYSLHNIIPCPFTHYVKVMIVGKQVLYGDNIDLLVTDKIKIIEIIPVNNISQHIGTQKIKTFNNMEFNFVDGCFNNEENDQPAIKMGSLKIWLKMNTYHRDNGLCHYDYKDGTIQIWYDHNGKIHRDNNLPAVISRGLNEYWFHGSFIKYDDDCIYGYIGKSKCKNNILPYEIYPIPSLASNDTDELYYRVKTKHVDFEYSLSYKTNNIDILYELTKEELFNEPIQNGVIILYSGTLCKVAGGLLHSKKNTPTVFFPNKTLEYYTMGVKYEPDNSTL